MSSIFLIRSLDVERLDKMNQITAPCRPGAPRHRLARYRDSRDLASERLDGVAAILRAAGPVRALLKCSAPIAAGASLASYLAVRGALHARADRYGIGDTMARRDEVMRFLTERRESSPSQSPKVVVL